MASLVSDSPCSARAASICASNRWAAPKSVRTKGSKPMSSRPQISFTGELYATEQISVKHLKHLVTASGKWFVADMRRSQLQCRASVQDDRDRRHGGPQ